VCARTTEQSYVDIAAVAVCRDIVILTSCLRVLSFRPSTQILLVSSDGYDVRFLLHCSYVLTKKVSFIYFLESF